MWKWNSPFHAIIILVFSYLIHKGNIVLDIYERIYIVHLEQQNLGLIVHQFLVVIAF